MGTKRAAADAHVKHWHKRQKTLASPEPASNEQQNKDPTNVQLQSQVFRFMDLPGELRNRIYEVASEYTHRCFPPIFSKKKPRFNRGSLPPKDPAPPLPYIGLTQSCSLLRSEFRPAWLSTHKIPLCALTTYLKAFFPTPGPRASSEVKKRLASQTTTAGSLRIWIRKPELANVDLTRLIRHAVRFPDCRITMHALPDVPAFVLDCLQALVTNKTDRWIKGVRNYKITQVGLVNPVVRIVVAERYAPMWMPLWSIGRAPDGYTQGLGLEEVEKCWTIHYAVDYS